HPLDRPQSKTLSAKPNLQLGILGTNFGESLEGTPAQPPCFRIYWLAGCAGNASWRLTGGVCGCCGRAASFRCPQRPAEACFQFLARICHEAVSDQIDSRLGKSAWLAVPCRDRGPDRKRRWRRGDCLAGSRGGERPRQQSGQCVAYIVEAD